MKKYFVIIGCDNYSLKNVPFDKEKRLYDFAKVEEYNACSNIEENEFDSYEEAKKYFDSIKKLDLTCNGNDVYMEYKMLFVRDENGDEVPEYDDIYVYANELYNDEELQKILHID
ncbi:MAG: hypothetical protein NC483_00445 [Ruminococcus sp.]|nr:hypothetical protein [Ruminococcus sp.]